MSKQLVIQGFSMIEIIMALAIFGVLLAGTASYVGFSLATLASQASYSQAGALAQEAMVAVKLIGRDNWSELTVVKSGLDYSDGRWSLLGEGTSDQIGNFTRQIEFSAVCRDVDSYVSNCELGQLDGESKKVVVTIAWEAWHGAKQVKFENYVSNW